MRTDEGPSSRRAQAALGIEAATDSQRSERRLAVLGTVLAVVAVHGANVGYRLFYDDYYWLEDRPSSAGEVIRWFIPNAGGGIYRPVLHAWFQGMRPIFGIDPLPYHLVALAAMISAALAVRWAASALNLSNLPATVSGILVGTHVALAPGTLWSSNAQTPVMIALVGCAMAITFTRADLGARIVSAVILALAIMTRDAAVMTPVIAAVLIAFARSTGPRWKPALLQTVSLWIVAATYGAIRLANGAFSSSDPNSPYRMTLGSHVFANLRLLMKFTARFGLSRLDEVAGDLFQRYWHLLFWAAVVVLALLAARRKSYLPVAGIVCFVIGTIPVLGIANKPLSQYYVDLGLIGLGIGVGALTQTFAVRRGVLVTGLIVFVITQMVCMQAFHSQSGFRGFVERTDALEAYSRSTRARDGVLVIRDACPSDRELARGADLFRAIRGDRDLIVRYEVRPPGDRQDCPST